MTTPDHGAGADETVQPEDDNPLEHTGEAVAAPDDAVEGGLYEAGDL